MPGTFASRRAPFLERSDVSATAAATSATVGDRAACVKAAVGHVRRSEGFSVAVDPNVLAVAPVTPAARIPYSFARTHGVLALAEEDGVVVVITRPDATVDGIAELKRVLQRPLTLRPVDAERFAMELARAYNAPSAGVAQVSDDLSREIDLTRLMQDLRRPRICSTTMRSRR